MASGRTARKALIVAGSAAIAIVGAAQLGSGSDMSTQALHQGTVILSSLASRARMLASPRHDDVIHVTQVLAAEDGRSGDRRPLTVDVWSGKVRPPDLATPAGAAPPPRRTLLLYTPGSAHARTDNAATAAALARQGYTVVALDDVELAPELKTAGIEPLQFDFSSAAAYDHTLQSGDEKIHRQALRLVEALDRLTSLSRRPDAPAWLQGLRLDTVGAFGWSLGGSTAAEASILDSRIKASVNLDGWLFGKAARGGVVAPYMVMLSDFPFPSDADLDDPLATRRYEARLTRRDLLEERRLIARPGSLGLRFPHAVHENLSDIALGASFWRTWFRVDPVRTKALVNSCLAAFFDHHLRGAPPQGCLDPAYAAQGVQRLTTIEWPGAGTATAPM